MGRRALINLLALSLLATAVGLFVIRRPDRCGEPVADPSAPFLTPGEARREDARLARLVDALEELPAPFGPALGAVGYDHDRWLSLSAAGDALLATTKGSAVWSMLAPGAAEPRWGIRAPRSGMAWDASQRRLFTLGGGSVTARDRQTGDAEWCRPLPGGASYDEVATAVLGDGLAVAAPDGAGSRVLRLSADGKPAFDRALDQPAADMIASGDQLVVGGVPPAQAWDPAALAERKQPAVQLAGLSPAGEVRWSRVASAGTNLRLAGSVGELVVAVESAARGGRVLGLRAGRQAWAARPLPGVLDVAVRGDIVLVRNEQQLVALNAMTGAVRWTRPVRQQPRQFPYGFTLDSAPSLDADRLLLPGTDALRVLDLRTGATTAYPLPTDGVRTTYWPYQLAVTPQTIGVVTNTGAVVLARE